MRIIAGSVKGRKLRTPTWAGTRPMSDKVRGALFDILGGSATGLAVLDLYAGTGAVGIEALSRGAASTVFVDKSKRCVHLIKDNLATTGLTNSGRVIGCDVEHFLTNHDDQKYDLVFFTPPYAIFSFDLLQQVADILAVDGMIVAEMASRDPVPEEFGGLALWQIREYGDTRLLFFERKVY